MSKFRNKLYTDILVWAFDHQEGFTEQEIVDEFGLRKNKTPDRWRWYQRVFLTGTNDNSPLITHFATNKDVGYWCLTEKGMSAAVDYIELKEAREASKKAVRLATLSFCLAAFVGLAQILIMLLT